ncbi:universal stress protein [Streptomyces sp. SID13666]|uniref:universal stress protein n=1 Tax=unclassified Streptomyces TaxID=2593676 RepID=UPI0013C23238|nr:universal stress protein [Streptomyces sp. SID13666]NEA70522.1 universal stress protein [Streptomyces sp. SID13588]
MSAPIAVGLDGSPESMAGARWAARDALRRNLPVRLVHVWNWHPHPGETSDGLEAQRHWAQRIPREAAAELTREYPALEIVIDQVGGQPAAVLPVVAEEAELLVLGSLQAKGISGFLVGSASLATVACAERPVVLIRSGETAQDEHQPDEAGLASTVTPYRDVVLGLDLARPCDELLEFAFDAALQRSARLRVIHCWKLPSAYKHRDATVGSTPESALVTQQAHALTEMLRPWRDKYPAVELIEESVPGKPAEHLLTASADTSLLVVGRRTSHSPIGRHIGPITLAVLHHCSAPVAVVPHA